MQRFHITVGAKTTAGGIVCTGNNSSTINGQGMAREGDEVYCPACKSTGTIVCDGPRLVDQMDGRSAALSGDLCLCKCRPLPQLIANQTFRFQTIEVGDTSPRAATVAQSDAAAAARPTLDNVQRSNGPTASSPRASAMPEQPGQACENLWLKYQQQAEAIIAPGGKLIEDPKARNRAINAAYAQLWLEDRRFQWAGLAAFASKQVGCGLLHAADSIEKIQVEYESGQRLEESARKGFWGLFSSRSERERSAKVRAFEQSKREHEEARGNNPMPSIDWRNEGESQSLVQQQLQHVYDMLAMGNTTLFLDVYPLHRFYKELGFRALERCLESRSSIFDHHPVIWPVDRRRLGFGINFQEILKAFELVERGGIAESVEHLARHEQVNILQPVMYSDPRFVALLRGNHASFVIGFPSGATQAIELTLASQCPRINDGRTIGFSENPFSDLSDISQRMPFVLNAADRFNELLHNGNRTQIEQAVRDISTGRGER
ncbi:PAAR domain-containing protein [Pseudomonas abieticivorans]|uniref:PAAR domain-containing protein n=1 Tax=Pseudomonas abieticivorans TaxID=2931382 RepID=UPI0020C06EF1|nr:PAAR domain-containing protein [Pseudomonas sp. PIA16]